MSAVIVTLILSAVITATAVVFFYEYAAIPARLSNAVHRDFKFLKTAILNAVRLGVASTSQGHILDFQSAQVSRDDEGIAFFIERIEIPSALPPEAQRQCYRAHGFSETLIDAFVPSPEDKPVEVPTVLMGDDVREVYEEGVALSGGKNDYERIFTLLCDGSPWTLRDLSARSGIPEATISARMRDMRKKGHNVTKVKNDSGKFTYTLAV